MNIIKICTLFLVLWFATGCTNMLFYPLKNHILLPDQYNIPYENIIFRSFDNLKLHGWWFPAKKHTNNTVVYIHGNAGNISTHAAGTYWLTNLGYNVFIFDYRGFGLSEGEVDLKGSIKDIQYAIDWAASRTPENNQLIVIGHSLGASMAVYSVANHTIKRKIDSLVLISAFSDYRLISRQLLSRHWLTWGLQWPMSFTINNDFRPLDYIGNIAPTPILIMHSPDDATIPYHHAEDLYKNAKQPKNQIKLEGDHNDIFYYKNNKQLLTNYLNSLM